MNCPRCQVALQTAPVVSGLAAHICPQCEGIWFPEQILHEFLQVDRTQLQNSAVAPSLKADHPQICLDPAIACPVCHQAMDRHGYGDLARVVIDSCFAHGVWLDDGELGRIHDFYHQHDRAIAVAAAAASQPKATPSLLRGLAELFFMKND